MNNENIQYTADSFMQCSNRVSTWVERFKEGRIALRNLPRLGRPPKVERNEMERIMHGHLDQEPPPRYSKTYAKRPEPRSTSRTSGSSCTGMD
ncbi:MAG: helix-turn-helix domain-containing protein [Thaumarchaeota archaeon]|nr:helix-turn-helix domain-containing protein [Nitrososphaerota archaeon]